MYKVLLRVLWGLLLLSLLPLLAVAVSISAEFGADLEGTFMEGKGKSVCEKRV